jgi:hypothetical protein
MIRRKIANTSVHSSTEPTLGLSKGFPVREPHRFPLTLSLSKGVIIR